MGGIQVAEYGTSFDFVFPVWNLTGEALFQPTWAAGDVKLSKDGAAEANPTNGSGLPSALQTHLNKITLTDAELQCKQLAIRIEDQGTKAWADDFWLIQTKGSHLAFHQDPLLLHAGTASAVGASSITLESPGPAAVPAGSVLYAYSGATNVPQVAVAESYVPTPNPVVTLSWPLGQPTGTVKYRLFVAPVVPQYVPANVMQVNSDLTAAQLLALSSKGIVSFTVAAGTNTTTAFTTSLTEAKANHYKPRAFVFLSGLLAQHTGFVDGYAKVGGNGVVTPLDAMPIAPSVGDTGILL